MICQKEVNKYYIELNNLNLDDFQKNSERECKMKINKFIIDFEKNIQVLLSLSNLFEQKTMFEIEILQSSIIEILNTENIKVQVKAKIVSDKMNEMNKLIEDNFSKIKNKLNEYENLSDQKIQRTKSYFYNSLKKFLK
jgi:hypothetical protein